MREDSRGDADASAALRWIACDLHCHSEHSDGRLDVAALARTARGRGLDLVVLCDHNTVSGHPEIPAAEAASGVAILPSIELTTFHGHLVGLGTRDFVEWRNLSRGNLDTALAEIHAKGGLAGVAHPFRPGSPFCTGCNWDFEVRDWGEVDYIEVWSEGDPTIVPYNRLSFELWTALLDEGFRISGVFASDYHGGQGRGLGTATWLGVEAGAAAAGGLSAAALEALRRGRVLVSLGSLLSLELRAEGGAAYRVGDELDSGAIAAPLEARVELERARPGKPQTALIAPERIELRSNLGILASQSVSGTPASLSIKVEPAGLRWLRAELHGRARGRPGLLAFTNPVYFRS